MSAFIYGKAHGAPSRGRAIYEVRLWTRDGAGFRLRLLKTRRCVNNASAVLLNFKWVSTHRDIQYTVRECVYVYMYIQYIGADNKWATSGQAAVCDLYSAHRWCNPFCSARMCMCVCVFVFSLTSGVRSAWACVSVGLRPSLQHPWETEQSPSSLVKSPSIHQVKPSRSCLIAIR